MSSNPDKKSPSGIDVTPMVIEPSNQEWKGHERFPGMEMKTLLTSKENPHLSLNIVRIPPGVELVYHHHPDHTETVYMIAGRGILTLGKTEVAFQAGQAVALPAGFQHCLKNTGTEEIQMITIFTPPLV